MTLVVDASVAVRWYVEGAGTPEALQLLEGEEPLLAPELIVAEVANVAWKLSRTGEISTEHGARIATAVATALDDLVPSSTLVTRAFVLAQALDHPVYDCLYVALADREDCQLVTADRRLIATLASSDRSQRARPLTA